MEVELIEGGRALRIAVTDTAEGFPTPETAPADAPRGRGLQIVSSLADAWGIDLHRDPPAKTVWFSSALPELPPGPVEFPMALPFEWKARAVLDTQPSVANGLDRLFEAGRHGPRLRVRRRTRRTGLRSASAPSSTNCVTPWWPPTSRA